ncbi:MAG TPA: ATP-binding protein [Candidatus Sulfotelmatobacter sp.]|nr:ATP-binding protein [Candidatus Sulfotelmatobacter sp.]
MSNDKLIRAVDWFVPRELRTDTGTLWRARIFAISHLLGPCLGGVIFIYLYNADPHPGLPFWTLSLLASAFWMLPFAMKWTGQLTWAALFSVSDLTLISVLGSFFYGGVSSPFLPWFLTALLLGFFYLGERPFLVLGIFAVNLAGFCIAYVVNGAFPELVPVADLSGVGVISVSAATLYTSMMAVYYANVITAQSELRKEVEAHLVTAAKMRETKERADRANEAKSVFLAKMSHQLRTPLNAVIGYSEILLEDADETGDAMEKADLKRINRAGRHLLSLVADVLDMSKIDSDNIELLVQRFDLGNFVDDVVSTCDSLVTINGNKFFVEAAEGLGTVLSDETRLRQVLINLLSNAGKFTRHGRITLKVSRESSGVADTIVLSVQDTGIGIAPETLERLFTDFNQAEVSTASLYGGTGLGLALSRKLCHVMQGEILVESELGRGSTFTVRIPAAVEPLAAAA